MLKLDSVIIYGLQICKVIGIEKKMIGNITKDYYVLSPIYDDKNTIYVPCDNNELMKKIKDIMSEDEIMGLINDMPDNEPLWIEDDKERAAFYKEILEKGKRGDKIRIIKTLYEKRLELSAVGKKLRNSDEQVFERAEKIIYDEMALVLDIKREEVVPFILKQIKNK